MLVAGCGDILEPERSANRRVQTESGLELLWRTPYTGTPWYSGKPAVEGDRLFTGMGNAVVALDVRTGTRIWGTPIRGNLALGGDNIVARDGAVFLADVDAVFSFDAESGAVRWRFVPDSPAYAAKSAVDERALYIGTRNHRVYALNKESGQPIWSVDVGPDWGVTAFPNMGVITGLFVAGDRVFATADRGIEGVPYRRVGVIVALDRTTGRELWRYVSDDGYAPIYGALTVVGDLVIAGESSRNSFFALDASTGREVWRF
jgi:outer membrane protein assembly factor BamB